MTESEWREEICRVGKSLFDRGYVHATAGNISVRLDDGFLITPTDTCLGNLDPARLARLGPDGLQQSGDKASKTIALHTQIYTAAAAYEAETRCVIHTHSTHCVSLTLSLTYQRTLPRTALGPELLRAVTPYFVMKVGHVPLIPYARPGASQAAEAVADAIHRYFQAGMHIRAAMLSRLGPNVWHSNPAAAMATLEELEETARLVCLNASMVDELTDLQINELRQTFGAKW